MSCTRVRGGIAALAAVTPICVLLIGISISTSDDEALPDFSVMFFSEALPTSFVVIILPPLFGGILVYLGLTLYARNDEMVGYFLVLGIGCAIIAGHVAVLYAIIRIGQSPL